MARPVMWLFEVEFARWVSPDSTSLTVGICAPTATEAIRLAEDAATRAWTSDVSSLSVRCVRRCGGVHDSAPWPTLAEPAQDKDRDPTSAASPGGEGGERG